MDARLEGSYVIHTVETARKWPMERGFTVTEQKRKLMLTDMRDLM